MATAGNKKYSEMFVNRSNSASKNDNQLAIGESAIDLDELKSSKEGGVPILKFPNDIGEAHKKYRSIDFYILKDIAYQEALSTLKAAGEVAITGDFKRAKETISGALDKAGINVATLAPENCKSKNFHVVISLPIPNILTEEDTHSYDDNNLETPEAVTSNFQKFTNETSKYIDAVTQIGQQLVLPNRRTSRQLKQLPVLNPFTWKKYKGSAMKEFRFTFFLVPRTAEEAEQVMRIVYTLKKYSYGSKNRSELSSITDNKIANEFFVAAPPKVLMKFPNNLVNKMVNPGVCVISSISATYQEGNTVGMTADGVPRFIELTIALLEFNQRFQEDFEAIK